MIKQKTKIQIFCTLSKVYLAGYITSLPVLIQKNSEVNVAWNQNQVLTWSRGILGTYIILSRIENSLTNTICQDGKLGEESMRWFENKELLIRRPLK